MKKILVLLVGWLLAWNATAVAQNLVPWDGTVAETFAGGTGTEDDPYLIETPQQLAKMAAAIVPPVGSETYEGKYFRLENDLDLGGAQPEPQKWTAIGRNTGISFKGVFDGNGKKIYNLYVRNDGSDYFYRGLFGAVGKTSDGTTLGMIKNLTIASGSVYAQKNAGGIVGLNEGIIENCRNYADVETWDASTNWAPAGGICAESSGKISGCVNYGTVTGKLRVGGLVGYLNKANGQQQGILENSLNFGTVRCQEEAPNAILGGLVGCATGRMVSVIENCANFGTIDMNGYSGGVGNVGCLVGIIGETSTAYIRMKHCFNAGSAYIANQQIAGIANVSVANPSPENFSVENCYNDLQISGQAIDMKSVSETALCLKTADMTKAEGLPGFDAAIWDFTAGAYPLLKNLADDEAKVRSVAPVLGYTDATTYDVFNAVRGNFTLPAAYGASWSVEKGTAVSVEGTAATVTRPRDKSDTVVLKVTLGTKSLERMIVVLMGAVPLTIETVENGLVKVYQGETALANGDLVEENTQLRLEAAPADGYLLDYFSVNGERWEEPLFVIKGATTVSAVFREDRDPEVWDGTIATAFGGGAGSITAPYQIRTPQELAYLAQQVNAGTNYAGKYFIVMHNLDLGGREWTPIGYQGNDSESSDPSEKSRVFSAEFDGQDKVIRNLSIKAATNNYVGLFGYTDKMNTIQNLTVENGYIKTDNADAVVGMLVGMSGSDLMNCHVSGRIEGVARVIGGVAGNPGVHTERCTNRANIVATANEIGGIGGFIMVRSINYCSNLADSIVNLTPGSRGMAGGIVGNSSGSKVQYCYNAALIKGLYVAGGIAGSSITSMGSTNSAVNNCYNTGTVDGARAGGIVGQCSGSIAACFNTGRVIGVSYAGGMAPSFAARDKSVVDCYNIGEVSVSDPNGMAGDIIGHYQYGTLRNLYVDKQMNPKAKVIGSQADNAAWRILTRDFTTGLPVGFDERDWEVQEGRYPHLKNVVAHESLELATAALTLHATNDSVYDVLDGVRFDAGIYAGVEGLTWTVTQGQGITVEGSVLKVRGGATEEACELKATLGNRSKTYRLLVQPLRFRLIVAQTEGGTVTAKTEDGETVTSDMKLAPGSKVILNYTVLEGYDFVEWSDGSKGETLTLTMDNDKTVSAKFAKQTFTITATAGEHGSIAPAGVTEIVYGGSQTYTIMANDGYEIEKLLVDGEAVEPAASYTFPSVKANHTIDVTFQPIMFKISATCGENGTMEPVGDTLIPYGGEITYTIKPAAGYEIDKLTVDGINIEAVATYTFSRIVANHQINVTFKEMTAVEAVETLRASVQVYAEDGAVVVANRGEKAVEANLYTLTGRLQQRAMVSGGASQRWTVMTGGLYIVRIQQDGTGYTWKVAVL